MRNKYYNLNLNSTTMVNEHTAKYSQPTAFTGYAHVIQEQRSQMLKEVKNPLVAGPNLVQNVKE